MNLAEMAEFLVKQPSLKCLPVEHLSVNLESKKALGINHQHLQADEPHRGGKAGELASVILRITHLCSQ